VPKRRRSLARFLDPERTLGMTASHAAARRAPSAKRRLTNPRNEFSILFYRDYRAESRGE
jgi:hypothetical protein